VAIKLDSHNEKLTNCDDAYIKNVLI